MSENTFDNPDEQVNYAIQLILNAYEIKSEYYENEIKRLQDENEHKAQEYEKFVNSLIHEKETLESTLEKLERENKNLTEKLEMSFNEMKKFEKFKSSILNSINHNEIITGVNGIGNTNINSVRTISASNSIPTNRQMWNQREQPSEQENSITIKEHKDSRIEKLIEKLNDSINNRIYPPQDPCEEEQPDSYDEKEFNRENLEQKISNNLIYQNRKNNKNNLQFDNSTKKYSGNNNGTETPKSLHNNSSRYCHEGLSRQNNMKKSNTQSQLNNDEKTLKNAKKSDQYVLSSKFFSECRVRLKEEEYSDLINTLKLCNNNKIDKIETFNRIEKILKNYENLKNDFKKIFPNI